MVVKERSSSLRLYLATPFPPPSGGIANWTSVITNEISKHDKIEISTIDISLKREARDRDLLDNFKGLIRIVKDASRCMSHKADHREDNALLHICTSGGKGFIRDLLLICIAHRFDIPAVVHFHFGRIPELLSTRCIESWLLRRVLNCADGLICMDMNTELSLSINGYKRKTVLIPNPIDGGKFEANYQNKDDCVIFVGHVNKDKGVTDLVNSWSRLQDKLAGTKLKIVGPVQDDYTNVLCGLCPSGNLELCGQLSHDEAMEEIARSKCLLLPSYTEGFPNVVLEAFALGTPVIASNVGALPEILSGGAGLIIEPGDLDGICDAILELLGSDSLRLKMAHVARHKLDHFFTSSRVLAQLLVFWNSTTMNRHT